MSGSGICQIKGRSSSTDFRGFRGGERKERKNLDTLFIARRNLARDRRTGFLVPCTSLSDCGTMLPTALPLPHHLERTVSETKLLHDFR